MSSTTTALDMMMNMTNSSGPPEMPPMPPKVSTEANVILSILFTLICATGVIGNALVIFVILVDRKMRKSSTNLFIMNLAFCDFVILLLGIPEMVLFMMDRGWLLGQAFCKCNRYVMTSSLYASVLTLLSVCVERFIAIIHPIKAHIMCGRKKVVWAICLLWPIALMCGLPTAIFNNDSKLPIPGVDISFCMLMFPGDKTIREKRMAAFKVTESLLYYVLPILIQIVLYSVVGTRLFAGIEELHAQSQTGQQNGGRPVETSEAVKARKGVVIMLIACVVVYCISFSPQAILVFYNLFSDEPFHMTWSFMGFVMIMLNVNSAANPVLYGIFSQNFRKRFKYYVCYWCRRAAGHKYTGISDFDSKTSRRPPSSSKTIVSSV